MSLARKSSHEDGSALENHPESIYKYTHEAVKGANNFASTPPASAMPFGEDWPATSWGYYTPPREHSQLGVNIRI
jgi:hypothetical protein